MAFSGRPLTLAVVALVRLSCLRPRSRPDGEDNMRRLALALGALLLLTGYYTSALS
jgi:hypothetical protein